MSLINTKNIYTINSFILKEEYKYPEATGEFTDLLHDLTLAMRIIAFEARRAGLNDILGLTQHTNVHGEKVMKLDEFANEVIINTMSRGNYLCAMASEENQEIIKLPTDRKKGKYILLFDPLDGSTNIDVNITTGTIFSIYKRIDETFVGDGFLEDLLQPGMKQVAAGYCLYGASTTLVYSTGHGVNIFTYDPTIGEFLLAKERIQIPQRGKSYSCNEGNYYLWDEKVRNYLDHIKKPKDETNRAYTARYVASSVADIHRTLHFGGIYLYPADKHYPLGKMRLVYEVNPLSFIVEQAGGIATDGFTRILELKPTSIHQRIPFFIGSPDNVNELMNFLK